MVRENPDENRSHEAARTNAAKLQGIGTTASQSQREMAATGTPQHGALGVPERVPTARFNGIEDVENSVFNFLKLGF